MKVSICSRERVSGSAQRAGSLETLEEISSSVSKQINFLPAVSHVFVSLLVNLRFFFFILLLQ